MKKWNSTSAHIAYLEHKTLTHKEIAEIIGKKPKTVAAWLANRGLLKRPNYTETEIYILQNFHVHNCAQFIPNKSINALKIKQCRLRKATPAN